MLATVRKAEEKRGKKKKNSSEQTRKEDHERTVIKRLIDGFYDPWDLDVSGGTSSFQGQPVFESLKCKLFYEPHCKKT